MEKKGPVQSIVKFFWDYLQSEQTASIESFTDEQLKEQLPQVAGFLSREVGSMVEYNRERSQRRGAHKKYRAKREWVHLLAPLEALLRRNPQEESYFFEDNSFEAGKHEKWQVSRLRSVGEPNPFSREVSLTFRETETSPRYTIRYSQLNTLGEQNNRLLQIAITPSPYNATQVGVKLTPDEYYLLFYQNSTVLSSRQVTVQNSGRVIWD